MNNQFTVIIYSRCKNLFIILFSTVTRQMKLKNQISIIEPFILKVGQVLFEKNEDNDKYI